MIASLRGILGVPRRGIALPHCSRWRETGAFNAVPRPERAPAGHARGNFMSSLYGDCAPPKKPAAVLAIRFVLLRRAHGAPEKVILQQEYSRAIPLPPHRRRPHGGLEPGPRPDT